MTANNGTTDVLAPRVPDGTRAGQPVRTPRRTFFRKASMLGAAVVGAIAGTWLDQPAALAAPGCCSLYYPNGPWCGGTAGVDGVNWNCPSGYVKRYWTCHTEHFYYTCWECNKGGTCWDSPFACSNYKVVYVP
jgi:hypothetical protein